MLHDDAHGGYMVESMSLGRKGPVVKSGQSRGTGRKRGEIDSETRSRITAWLRYEMHRRRVSGLTPSHREFAKKLDLSNTYISRILSNSQTPGLELVIRLHRTCGISADVLLDDNPPARFFKLGSESE